MPDIDRLCYGCMREKNTKDDICPYCGFDRISYEKTRSTRALPLGTILDGKYLLEKCWAREASGSPTLPWI